MAVMTTLPSGFRFVPTDLELIRDYLLKKLTNQPLPSDDGVIEYDVFNIEPWNLPVNNHTANCTRFYSRKIRKRSYYLVRREKNDDKSLCDGNVVKHMVKCGDGTSKSIVGYWKRKRPTPHDRLVRDEKKQIVGIMKAFVFYYYTPNKGNNENKRLAIETGWLMHEYTLNSQSQQFQPWVLCSIINKSRFNIGIDYDDNNNYIERINFPPIDRPEAERINEMFASAAWGG